jgi:hypothetical protein
MTERWLNLQKIRCKQKMIDVNHNGQSLEDHISQPMSKGMFFGVSGQVFG